MKITVILENYGQFWKQQSLKKRSFWKKGHFDNHSLRDWSVPIVQLIISISGSLEWMTLFWSSFWWIDQCDWFSIFIQVKWCFDFSNSEIIDDLDAIICWMTNENVCLNLLTGLIPGYKSIGFSILVLQFLKNQYCFGNKLLNIEFAQNKKSGKIILKFSYRSIYWQYIVTNMSTLIFQFFKNQYWCCQNQFIAQQYFNIGIGIFEKPILILQFSENQ